MDNIMDYMRWRGDLSFKAAPFCEVDSLVICKLCCVDFTGFIPPVGQGEISVSDCSKAYFASDKAEHKHLGLLIPAMALQLLKAMGESVRFGGVMLSDYVNSVSETEEKQFSALTFELGDGTRYIAYRGTDDTIVGWKENFEMSYCDAVPAQLDAAEYLLERALSYPEALRVGGHSKGGNLAVYAAMTVPLFVQERICGVHNFDGPGFGRNVMASEEYLNIRGKLMTVLPQSSIVGMLLEHEEEYEVVKSDSIGPFQHDGFTWEVSGTRLVRLDAVTGGAKHRDAVLKAWISAMNLDERRQFTEAFFGVLQSTGARTLTELTSGGVNSAVKMINSMRGFDKQTREMLVRCMKLLLLESMRIHSPKAQLQESQT